MKIVAYRIRHESWEDWKNINIGPSVNIIYSDKNSTGKTTLMRSLLYSLGFKIPNTEDVKFDKYEFELTIERKGKVIKVYRKNNSLQIDDEFCDAVIDERKIVRLIFGIDNHELMDNLLGVCYFDQDKGWTLLNRGKIIANNRFNISSFLRGLNDDSNEESRIISERIRGIEDKINEYKLLGDIAEYQQQLDATELVEAPTTDDVDDTNMAELQIELGMLKKEIESVRKTIRQNDEFYNYIEKAQIFVKNPLDENNPIRVTRNSMLYGGDYTKINKIRLESLELRRSKLDRKIIELKARDGREIRIVNIESLDETIAKKIKKMETISIVQITKAKDELVKEKNKLERELIERTKINNPYIERIYNDISKYLTELDVTIKNLDIFTSNLKTKSGSRLHRMVFSFKMGYILSLNHKFCDPFVIFCDSPGGREIKKNIIDKTMTILKRDFQDSQLFIASIDKFENIFENANIIKMDGTLFDPAKLV